MKQQVISTLVTDKTPEHKIQQISSVSQYTPLWKQKESLLS